MSHYLKWTWQFTSACKIINWKNTILEVEVAKCDGWIQDTCFKNQWLFYTLLTKKIQNAIAILPTTLKIQNQSICPKISIQRTEPVCSTQKTELFEEMEILNTLIWSLQIIYRHQITIWCVKFKNKLFIKIWHPLLE